MSGPPFFVVSSNQTISEPDDDAGVVFVGSGASLTLTGDSNNISFQSVTDITDALTVIGQSNTLDIGSVGSPITVNAAGSATIGDGDIVTVTGTGNDVFVGGSGNIVAVSGTSGNIVSLDGSGNDVQTANSDVTFYAGIQGWVSGGDDTVNLFQYVQVSLIGDGYAVSETAADQVTLDGNDSTLTITGDGTASNIVGNANNIALNGNFGSLAIDGIANTATVDGISNTVSLAGSGNSLVDNDTSGVIQVSGVGQTIQVNDAAITVAANAGLTLDGASGYGNGDSLNLGTADTVDVLGSDDSIAASAGDVVTLAGQNEDLSASGTGDIVTFAGMGGAAEMSGGTLDLGPGAAASLIGNDNIVNLAAGSTLTLLGSGNEIVGSGTGANVGIESGSNNVAMTDGTLSLSGGAAASSGFAVDGFAYNSYSDGEFATPVAAQSLQQLAATGANSVLIDITQYIAEPGGGAETGTTIGPTSSTESNASIQQAIDNAKADGLSVFLRPQADPSDGSWSALIDPSNPAAFFASYDSFILNYATIAAQNNVAMFSIGDELASLTGPAYESYWSTLITDVKSVFAAYNDTTTQLTYSSAYFEAGSVSFWGSLNVIGVNAYEALTTQADPSVAALVAGWTTTPNAATGNEAPLTFYQSLSAQFAEPILFSEVGYQSVEGTNELAGSAAPVGTPVSYQAQSNALEAFFQTFSPYALSAGQTLSTANFVDGAYVWEWNPDPANVRPGDYSVQGKPALGVVESWYDNAALSSGGLTTIEGAGNVIVFGDTGGIVELTSGSIVSTTVSEGDVEIVATGGTASGTVVNSGGTEVVVAGGTASGTTVINGGYQYLSGGGIAADTVVSSGGTQVVSWLTAAIRSQLMSGSGSTQSGSWLTSAIRTRLMNGATQEVLSGGVASATVVSAGGTEIVFSGGVASDTTLLSGGTIDLAALSFVSGGGGVSLNSATDVVTIKEGLISATLSLVGTYDPADFQLSQDNAGGTLLTLSDVACYCPGTRIATPDGDVPIEQLAIGDLVLTAHGAARPLRWIGRRSYNAAFVGDNPQLRPIRIAAGALADAVPDRDLLVSPLHALYLDGLLIPAVELVNGASIVATRAGGDVHYLHLELDSHDVILANKAAAESFVDDDSRMMFHNAADYLSRYPDAPHRPALYCAPRVSHGYALEAIRRRLGVRAGVRGPPPREPLRGFVDRVNGRDIEGWAQNPDRPEVPVCLDILIDGILVAQTLADRSRGDLLRAGLGSGRHGFMARLGQPVCSARSVSVRRSCDGAVLPMSATARPSPDVVPATRAA